MKMYSDVLDFWFREIKPSMWWIADAEFDREIRQRFGELHQRASRCELFEWRHEPKGRLAEIIVLDQFSRNIFRNSPQAFAHDAMALTLSQEAIDRGAATSLNAAERSFLYMPFMHSESKLIHELAEDLFRDNGIAENYEFELKHKAIIDRFGRYPHRNEVMGRTSTREEIEFLKQPGSSF